MVPTGMLPEQEANRLEGTWVLVTTAWQQRGHERGLVGGYELKARPDKESWNTSIPSWPGGQKVLTFIPFQVKEVPRSRGSRL